MESTCIQFLVDGICLHGFRKIKTARGDISGPGSAVSVQEFNTAPHLVHRTGTFHFVELQHLAHNFPVLPSGKIENAAVCLNLNLLVCRLDLNIRAEHLILHISVDCGSVFLKRDLAPSVVTYAGALHLVSKDQGSRLCPALSGHCIDLRRLCSYIYGIITGSHSYCAAASVFCRKSLQRPSFFLSALHDSLVICHSSIDSAPAQPEHRACEKQAKSIFHACVTSFFITLLFI